MGLADLTRRGLVAGLLAGVALPAWADAKAGSARPKPRPARAVDASAAAGPAADLVTAAKLGGVVGYIVADAASGRVLEAANDTAALPPASVTKAVTTLYALEQLGPAFRFTTKVMRAGKVTGAQLDGDLILAGGGDPTFDTDKMGDLVAALAATGLRRISGRFIAYAGALPERDAIAPDQPDFVDYNPAISGLMLNFDRVNFVWKAANAGWQTEINAQGERFVPQVQMATMQIAARDAPKFTYARGEGQDHWTVAASALGHAGSRWLPVRHAAIYVAEVFRTLCAAQGIDLPQAEIVYTLPDAAEVIVAHQSEALPDLLKTMLKFSTNLTAEAVGLTASGAGSLPASAQAMTDWAQRRLGIAAVFGDHSGLGPVSRITAGEMMRVMQNAQKATHGDLLHDLLREKGVPGADGQEQKGSPLRVHAKSGTMNFVSNLAGYLEAPGKPGLVFAIFTADVPRHDAIPVEARENPEGERAWVRRSRQLQKQLLNRWAAAYL